MAAAWPRSSFCTPRSVIGVIVVMLLIFGSYIVGGAMAVRKRWNRPLFCLGVYALLVVANVLLLLVAGAVGSGRLARTSIGRAWMVGSEYVGLPLPLFATVFCIVWLVCGRHRLFHRISDKLDGRGDSAAHRKVHP